MRAAIITSTIDSRLGVGTYASLLGDFDGSHGRALSRGGDKPEKAKAAAMVIVAKAHTELPPLAGWPPQPEYVLSTSGSGDVAPLEENGVAVATSGALAALAELAAAHRRGYVLSLGALFDAETGLGAMGHGLEQAPTGVRGGAVTALLAAFSARALVEGVATAVAAPALGIVAIRGFGATPLAAEIAASPGLGVIRLGSASFRDPSAALASMGHEDARESLRALLKRTSSRMGELLAGDEDAEADAHFPSAWMPLAPLPEAIIAARCDQLLGIIKDRRSRRGGGMSGWSYMTMDLLVNGTRAVAEDLVEMLQLLAAGKLLACRTQPRSADCRSTRAMWRTSRCAPSACPRCSYASCHRPRQTSSRPMHWRACTTTTSAVPRALPEH